LVSTLPLLLSDSLSFDFVDPAVTPGIPVEFSSDKSKQKRGKEGLQKTLKLVQNSTASMGR
jgi:hypothetical protein